MNTHKMCSQCQKSKLLKDFSNNKKGKWGKHSVCKGCTKVQQREYRKRTNYRIDRKWREENIEKVRQASREFYARNKERERNRNRERYRKMMIENPERVREWGRKYSKTNRGRFNSYKKQAKKRGYAFTITLEIFSKIVEKNCVYCGGSSDVGIDRKNNKKGYVKLNMVPCCCRCNYMKRDFNEKDFINHCIKVTQFNPGRV